MTIPQSHDEVKFTATVNSAAKTETSIVLCRRSSLLLKKKSMEKKFHRHHDQQQPRQCDMQSTTGCRHRKEQDPNDPHRHEKQKKVDWILSQLSLDEIEIAARSCYEYMKQQQQQQQQQHSDTTRTKLSSSSSNNNCASQQQQQQQYARSMIERYLVSKKGNTELALQKVRKTLQFRKKFGIEKLITIFYDVEGDDIDSNKDGDDSGGVSCAGNTVSDSSSSSSSISSNQSIPTSCRENLTNRSTITGRHREQQKETLKSHLKHQKYFVQGYDRDGRSTLYFIPRNVQGHDMEWTMKEAIYSIERAVACSRSNDDNKTINAIVDFSGFNISKHSPPVDIGKEFLTTLRSHYAGQIHSIYLINTPFSFNILWKIFSPFVGSQTREKIKFWNHNNNNNNNNNRGHEKNSSSPLLELYEIDQLPNWLVDGGRSNRSFDIDEYLHELSFDEAFDGRENNK